MLCTKIFEKFNVYQKLIFNSDNLNDFLSAAQSISRFSPKHVESEISIVGRGIASSTHWYSPISIYGRLASGLSLPEEYLAEVVRKVSIRSLPIYSFSQLFFPDVECIPYSVLGLLTDDHGATSKEFGIVRHLVSRTHYESWNPSHLAYRLSKSAEFSAEPLSWWTNMLSILNARSPWRAGKCER